MIKYRFALLAATFCAAALLPSQVKASIITYNFTYTGTGTYTGSETASGSGQIAFNVTSLGTGSLANITLFNFTDTLTAPGPVHSTFTYGLGNISSASEVFGGTLLNPTLTNLTLQTGYLGGTNSTFGNVDFVLNYSGVTSDSTGATTAAYLPDFTSGGGTMTFTPTASAPEPSSLLLLGTGMAGAALLYAVRKRIAPGLSR